MLLLFGMLLDAREEAHRPQQVEVLLRHDNQAWLLTVMRNRTGEVYAPDDEELLVARPVDLRDIDHGVLGCPRFKPVIASGEGDSNVELFGFRVLGTLYICQD